MRKSDLPACSHMRSEEKSRDIFLKGARARADNGSETETVRSTAVAASFASSEALSFVSYGLLVSLVVTHIVMFTHVALYLHTFIMVYTRNGQDVVVYWYNIHTYHTMYNVSKFKEPMCCIHVQCIDMYMYIYMYVLYSTVLEETSTSRAV